MVHPQDLSEGAFAVQERVSMVPLTLLALLAGVNELHGLGPP
jgi:hypothetical protein